MEFEVEELEQGKSLNIKGDLTIQHAAEFLDVLRETLDSTNDLLLNVQNVTDLDLSCLQLISSAHLTSIKMNKKFTICGNCPEVFRDFVRDAGYARHMECKEKCDKECLWTDETNEY